MRFVIVTGMSGAGKSTALKMLEDVGYFCVDNLPIPVIPALASLLSGANSEIDKLALGIDIRDERNFTELEEVLKKIDDTGFAYEVLFLEAGDDVLIKRYQETRRTHPIAGNERLDKGIELEREKLKFLKSKATYIVDTSKMLTRELKGELNKIFVENKEFKNLYITVLSFGFKYGIPNDADLVFNVRFLPNPYYIEELREQTGDDAPVYDYVMSFDQTKEFIRHLKSFLDYVFIQYKNEKKNHLTVGIGCTGGHHRSVSVTNWLYSHYRDHYHCYKSHRDKKVG